jgi:hypothetical protein
VATAVSFTTRYGPGLNLNSASGFQLVEEGFWLEAQSREREWLSQPPYPGAVSVGDHEGIRIAHAKERMTQQGSGDAMVALYQQFVAELRRPVNEIRWLPHGTTYPFFLDTFGSGFESLSRGQGPPNAFYLLQDKEGMDIPIPISPVIRGPGANLLTENQSTFAIGTSGWLAGTGTVTVAHNSTQGISADPCLQLTATGAAGTLRVNSPNPLQSGIAVRIASGVAVAGSIYFRSAATPRSCTVEVGFADSTGAGISQTAGSAITSATASWVRPFFETTSPANAAWMWVAAVVSGTSAGEVHYIDQPQLEIGTLSAYKVGGQGAAI